MSACRSSSVEQAGPTTARDAPSPPPRVAAAAVGHRATLPQSYLVRLKPDTSVADKRRLFGHARLRRYANIPDLYWVEPPPDTAETFSAALEEQEDIILYAEPNAKIHAHTAVSPNDTNFADQWTLKDASMGIDAPTLWGSLGTGDKDLVIPVIDSGVDCEHRDLKANLWENPFDKPGGGDDDGDGHIDDVMGLNTLDPSQPPCDTFGHGTAVAGIIAAVGNNGDAGDTSGSPFKSISGAVWKGKILACKCMDGNDGNVDKAIECIDYIVGLKKLHPQMRIPAVNASWGDLSWNDDPVKSQGLEDAIGRLRLEGILFVTSAGNCVDRDCQRDLDQFPRYPASSMQPNVITVAATSAKGLLLSTSKRGQHTVHIAAPGDDVLVLAPGNSFQNLSSTSMAAPLVTGLIALLDQDTEEANWTSLRALVLASGVWNPALQTAIISGRRIGGSAIATKDCVKPLLQARLAPKSSDASVGIPVLLAAMQFNCAETASGTSLEVEVVDPSSNVSTLSLSDNGNGVPGDGVFSAMFTPTEKGDYHVTFFKGVAGNEDPLILNVK